MTDTATHKPKKRASRWGLIVPWALFALIALGWFGYWTLLKDQAVKQIDAAIAQAQAKGLDAGYGSVSADGFPMRLSLRFKEVRYAPADAAWRVTAPLVSVHVNPTNPLHIIAGFDSAATLAGSGGSEHVFQAKTAALSVRVDTSGALQRISLELDGFALSRAGEAQPGSRIAKLVAHVRPDARSPGRLQLAADGAGVRLARPVTRFEALGQDIAELHLRGTLEAPPGALSPDALIVAVTDGVLRLEGFGLTWGPTTLTGVGEIGLDPQHRPEGALDVTIADPAATFAALGAPELAALAPTNQPLTAPLTAKGGVLSLGPVPLRALPPLY